MSEYCSHSRQSRHFMTLFWCAIKEIWYIGAIIEWQITINYWTKLSPNHFTFLTESACHYQLGDIWQYRDQYEYQFKLYAFVHTFVTSHWYLNRREREQQQDRGGGKGRRRLSVLVLLWRVVRILYNVSEKHHPSLSMGLSKIWDFSWKISVLV